MSEHDYEELEEMTITLTLDDDTEIECDVIAIFPVNAKQYIALLPQDASDDEEGEIFLYRYSETDDKQPILDMIEDEEEYEAVADFFDEMMDDEEYEEMFADEDEEEDEEDK